MKKLTLRLLVLILSVYVAGSIYPLLAHEPPCRGPATGTAPAPAPTPTKPPASPAMLGGGIGGTMAPPLSPPAKLGGGTGGTMDPLQPPSGVERAPDTGFSGCGSAEVTYKPAVVASNEARDSVNPKKLASIIESKIEMMDREAKKRLEPLTRSLELAQNRYNQANIEVTKYLKQKQQGTLIDNDLLEMAQDERQESLAEIQRLKGDIEKVKHWGPQQEAEMRVLENRALNGDYMSYIKLRDYNTKLPPTSQLK